MGRRPESPTAGPPPESGGQTPARGESPHHYRSLLSAATKGSGLQAMTCLGGQKSPRTGGNHSIPENRPKAQTSGMFLTVPNRRDMSLEP